MTLTYAAVVAEAERHLALKALPLRHPFGHEVRLRHEAALADAMEAALRSVFRDLRERLEAEVELDPYPAPAPRWLRKAIWDMFADDPWWAGIQERLRRGLAAQALAIVLDGGRDAEALVGYGVEWGKVDPKLLAFTDRYTHAWVKKLTETRRAGLIEALKAWQQGGLGTRGMPDLVRAIAPLFTRESAERIAVTETTRLYAEGNLAAWREIEGIAMVEVATAEDELVCQICRTLNGKRWPKNKPLHVPPFHVG